MKGTIILFSLLNIILIPYRIQAQLAKQPQVSYEQLAEHISSLMAEESTKAKNALKKEASIMEKSKDEKVLILASTIYENSLNNSKKASQLLNLIKSKFPKGLLARKESFEELLEEKDRDISLESLEGKYRSWLKEFPEEAFSDYEPEMYEKFIEELAKKYFDNKDHKQVIKLIHELKNKENLLSAFYFIARDTPEEYSPLYLDLLLHCYTISNEALLSEVKTPKQINQAKYAAFYSSMYGKALYINKQYDEAIAVLLPSLESKKYTGYDESFQAETLAKCYIMKQNYTDAFAVLEKAMINNGANENLRIVSESIFDKIDNHSDSYRTYLVKIRGEYRKVLLKEYEQKMINVEAPQFTLLDRNGKEVSLSDFRGKVVVIDFWATWCVSCMGTFPALQEVIDKYKNDDKVEFLFINTLERDKNYKQKAGNYITDNKYSFTLLFDEMNDVSNSVSTAFGVKSLPYKIVIDEKGFIKFKSMNPTDNLEEIVTELEIKIELAKKNSV